MKKTILLMVIIFLAMSCRKDDSSGGTGSFTVNGQTVSGSCSSYSSTSGCSLNSVSIDNKFFIISMPTESSGNFTIYGVGGCKLQAMMNREVVGDAYTVVSQSGTLTKTGARSFKFQCTMSNGNTGAKTYQISGEGSY